MAAFLATVKDLPAPWEALFKKRICSFCFYTDCDWCPNEPNYSDEVGPGKPCKYRDSIFEIAAWWLRQETESTVGAREKVMELTTVAMKRELMAQDEETTALLRSAAGTISGLLRELDEVR